MKKALAFVGLLGLMFTLKSAGSVEGSLLPIRITTVPRTVVLPLISDELAVYSMHFNIDRAQPLAELEQARWLGVFA